MSESKYQATIESIESSFFENMREHVFIAEVLQESWVRHKEQVEVLRSEVDNSGYDLVMACRGVIRHIQLRSSRHDARRQRQTVNCKLAGKPNGCVIWLLAEDNAETGRIRLRYLFFGNAPDEPVPDFDRFKVGKRIRRGPGGVRPERANTRQIPKSAFRKIESITELIQVLFGLTGSTVNVT
jgi:hypothetical protein